jgi:DNA-binding NarL/FixJ family response regulator
VRRLPAGGMRDEALRILLMGLTHGTIDAGDRRIDCLVDRAEPMQVAPTRVVVADDHPLFRDGVRALLATEPDLELVGEATGGDEAVALVGELRPDVVLMDVQMPGVGGIEATRRIAAMCPGAAVLVMTMFEDDHLVFAAMRAGARGYLLKGARQAEVLRAIRGVANGEVIFGPGVAARVLDFFTGAETAGAPPSLFPELSDREREVLVLLARGHKNAEIAARLVLSPKTVRNHVSTILGKLQVADRTQAAVRAREAGLG